MHQCNRILRTETELDSKVVVLGGVFKYAMIRSLQNSIDDLKDEISGLRKDRERISSKWLWRN